MRNITVLSTTKGEPVKLTSEASTWGQLKDALQRDFSQVDSMRATIKGLMTDLVASEAHLPEGDFVLYLTPQKIKGGGGSFKAIAIAYAEAQIKAWEYFLEAIEEEGEEEDPLEDEEEDDEEDEESRIDSEDLDAMRRLSGN